IVTTTTDILYPGEAGLGGRDVYATLVLGDNAYGTTELTGGGLQHIVKQLGSAGTADPLNQRATVGWKATKAAARLVEAFMVRIETASTFEVGEN
ncbi:MAG: N4-gp56 family major capsid protein, partial [Clostridia bacterium]|nr:N4-gp56 family major capsid protein [Clostridia bacterium]